MVEAILGNRDYTVVIRFELEEAFRYLQNKNANLVLLDLNLHGENGFNLLKAFAAENFPTIVTSAYKDRAIEAFEYGVLDFIPKPFRKDRLEKALQRWQQSQKAHYPTKYLVVRQVHRNEVIDVQKVVFIQGDGHHSLVQIENGPLLPHHKSLDQLLQLLPDHFERVHKSFIVNRQAISELEILPGSKYYLKTVGGFRVPVGRKFYRGLKGRFI